MTRYLYIYFYNTYKYRYDRQKRLESDFSVNFTRNSGQWPRMSAKYKYYWNVYYYCFWRNNRSDFCALLLIYILYKTQTQYKSFTATKRTSALAVATGSPAATATSAGRPSPLRDGSAVFYLQTRRNNNNNNNTLHALRRAVVTCGARRPEESRPAP